MNKWILSALFIIVLGALVIDRGIAVQNAAQPTSKLQVVGSFYPMQYFASQIAGNTAEVITITPADAEPHDYEPSTGDIVKIDQAKLLILNGEVEAWGAKIKANLQGSSTTVITAGDGLFTRTLTENGSSSQDPHIWLDPILAKQEVAKISSALQQVNPSQVTLYQSNQQNLDIRLDQLDAQYKTGLAHCQKRDIVTSHAAFGYLGARYGLNQVAIAGLSPDEEPSAEQLATVTDFVKKNDIHYIFFESLVSPKLSQTIATETGVQTLELNPIEGLTAQDQQQGKDYFTIMESNLSNLQTALVCQK